MTTRHAIVIGGTSGIGLETARMLLEDGMAVTVWGSSPHTVSDCSRRHPSIVSHGNAYFMAADLRNRVQVNNGYWEARDYFGPPSILVNCSARCLPGPLLGGTIDRWDDTVAVNLTGQYLTMRLAALDMLSGGWGRIVNVSSIAGRASSGFAGIAYTTTKSAILGLTRQAATELGRYGVTVNCVCPGPTDTPMLRNAVADADIEAYAKTVPIGRVAWPQEVASVIRFLVSNAASYVNGAIIDVNGGKL